MGWSDTQRSDARRRLTELLRNAMNSEAVWKVHDLGWHPWHKGTDVKRHYYALEHWNGQRFTYGDTGMGTIQVTGKRGRSTHCWPSELERRLDAFLKGDAKEVHHG